MTTTRQQGWLLLALVLVDALVKVAAFRMLIRDEPIRECLLCPILRVNTLVLGSSSLAFVASHGLQFLVPSTIFSAVLAISLLAIAIRWRFTRRSIVFAVALGFLLAAGFAVLHPSLGHLSYRAIASTSRIAQTSLWVVIWAFSTGPFWKMGALFFAAAGLSNSLSLIYPPYGVIDYLWSSPLNRLVGIGVFNLADIFWMIAFPVFAIALIVHVTRRINRKSPVLGGTSH